MPGRERSHRYAPSILTNRTLAPIEDGTGTWKGPIFEVRGLAAASANVAERARFCYHRYRNLLQVPRSTFR
jgi:hypothetical protein